MFIAILSVCFTLSNSDCSYLYIYKSHDPLLSQSFSFFSSPFFLHPHTQHSTYTYQIASPIASSHTFFTATFNFHYNCWLEEELQGFFLIILDNRQPKFTREIVALAKEINFPYTTQENPTLFQFRLKCLTQ